MGKKSRILCVLQYFMEHTDEEHPVSTGEIIAYLQEQGIHAHRTTIASDMELLMDVGIDIVTLRSSPNKYFIGQRIFQTAELKILADVVTSAKFLTRKKSQQLVEKLGGLTSRHMRPELERNIYLQQTVKPENEQIYYTVDKIQAAIRMGKWMSFQYWEYRPDKTLHHKNGGKLYKICPYSTIWNNDRYYVIGYCKEQKTIKTYRIDRMDHPLVLDESAVPPPENFDPAVYANQVFEMFHGISQIVKLKCPNRYMDSIIDKFGTSVTTDILDENHFVATVEVSISPRFYGWLFGFGGEIFLLSPQIVKDEYRSMLEKALQ